MTVRKICIDCVTAGLGTRRKASYPGPRCFTHHKAVNSIRSAARKAKHVSDNFGITEEQYQAILAAQGGGCYICRMKPGKKRLAVDHDHKLAELHDHPKDKGCPVCVRGLLCRNCNRNILGRLKDDPEALERGAFYLRNPPARRVLALMRGET